MSMSKEDKKLQKALQGLSGRKHRAAQEEANKKRRTIVYIVLAAVAALLVAALLFWDSGVIQRHTAAYVVGDESYSATAVEYYFYRSYNSIYSYASYYGIDTDTSLKEQEASDGVTWYDYLMEQATDAIDSVLILKQEGEAEGYKMSDDARQDVEDAMDELEETAAGYGISASSYLAQVYGRYMTVGYYRTLQEDYYYASDYASYKRDSFEVTDEEIDEYYTENADSLDEFDFECYLVNGTASSTTDEDGNTVDPTEEETAAALASAKAIADELLADLQAGDSDAVEALVDENSLTDYSSTSSSYLTSYDFGEWLIDSSRVSGDTTIVEKLSTSDDTTVTGYYVLKFNSRTLDEYYAYNVYSLQVNADTVTVEVGSGDSSVSAEAESGAEAETTTEYDMEGAKTEIEGYQQTWLDNGGTAEAFAKLAEEHSDSSSASSGGLTENAYKGAMTTLINDWLYNSGEERSVGDYAILEDESNHRYQLVYIDGQAEEYYWRTKVTSTLKSSKYSDWYTEVSESETYTPEQTDEFPDIDI